MNLFIFNGTICKNVELKMTQSGMAVLQNSLAFNKKDKNGKDKTTFIDFTAFGKTAELIAQYYAKGDRLLGRGEIDQESWQDAQSGQNRTKHKVLVSQIDFTKTPSGFGSSNNNGNGGGYNGKNNSDGNAFGTPPTSYGKYNEMPQEVKQAVARNNAQNNAQNGSQNGFIIDPDEIPF